MKKPQTIPTRIACVMAFSVILLHYLAIAFITPAPEPSIMLHSAQSDEEPYPISNDVGSSIKTIAVTYPAE